MEKRRFTRVVFFTEALARAGDKEIKGEAINVSINGMFLKTSEKLDHGTPLEIQLFLTGSTSELVVNLTGHVVRVEKDGLGVVFTDMDIDSFMHLRNIISYNSGDPERVESEFMNFLKKS